MRPAATATASRGAPSASALLLLTGHACLPRPIEPSLGGGPSARRLTTFYNVEASEQADRDAETGTAITSVRGCARERRQK